MAKFSDAFSDDFEKESSRYKFRLAVDGLEFHPFEVSDPVPTGVQLLEAAGVESRKGCSLFALLTSGDFEDVRLKETFDLRKRGVERFVCFTTGVLYPFKIDQSQLSWGLPTIQGSQLYELARVDDANAVFLDVPGGTDQLVDPAETIDLTQAGVKRFITAPRLIEIFINSRSHFVAESLISHEQLVQLAFPGSVDPNVIYSITYSFAASKPYSGDLNAGHSVLVKKGTRFNVTPTVQS